MRILVAGAAGVIGRRVVRRLVARGHQVTGTTRRPDRLAELAAAGAVGVVMDALDAASTERAVRQSAPDAVVHELTDLAGVDFAANARVRVEGTAHLVDACRACGVDRMVAQSISWVYAPGSGPATEDEAIDRDPASGEPRAPSVEALEHAVLGLPEGVVLRYGLFYGPGTWYAADGRYAAEARRGVVAAASAHTSFVHVDDAADATVAALGWPAGVVNVVDDEPTHVDEWGPRYVEALGGTVTAIGARTAGRAAANTRARSLGWVPAHPSWRTARFDLP